YRSRRSIEGVDLSPLAGGGDGASPAIFVRAGDGPRSKFHFHQIKASGIYGHFTCGGRAPPLHSTSCAAAAEINDDSGGVNPPPTHIGPRSRGPFFVWRLFEHGADVLVFRLELHAGGERHGFGKGGEILLQRLVRA